MSWTIRARLTLWHSLVVAAVLLVTGLVVAGVQRRLALDRYDAEIQRLMLTLDGVMKTEARENLTLEAGAHEASTEVVAPDRTLILLRADGSLLEQWGRPLAATWMPPVADAELRTIELGGHRLRVFSHPVSFLHYNYVAAVLAPLDVLEAESSELLLALAVGGLVAIVVAVTGGLFAARRALQPLTSLAAQTTAITDRNPSARLVPDSPNDELGVLAGAFNGVLDRLATALTSQRQFMAEAAHELRTPVSVLRTTTEVTLEREQRTEAEYREALLIVTDQARRMSRMVDAMFLLARAEAGGLPVLRETVSLEELLADCLRAIRNPAATRDVRVVIEGNQDLDFTGDGTLLRQLVTNLLDNAVRHTKPGGTVTIRILPGQADVQIDVADQGPGIPEAEREHIFERFVRLDWATGGAGLGLPIARWIAQAHRGRLELAASGPDGSCFRITLPLDGNAPAVSGVDHRPQGLGMGATSPTARP